MSFFDNVSHDVGSIVKNCNIVYNNNNSHIIMYTTMQY